MPTALLMQQSGPQAGPQGQSKTTTVTITGASRAFSLPSSRFSLAKPARGFRFVTLLQAPPRDLREIRAPRARTLLGDR